MALLSFYKLSKIRTNNWNGGLLLIDEMDAALHPSAQKKLMNLLIQTAKKLKFQIVITTHSSDLLKHISAKTSYNSNDKQNDIELYYFTNANRKLDVKRNIDYSTMEGDLFIESIIQSKNKVKLYSEDAENRWFLRHLIKDYFQYVDILDISIGCTQLIALYKCDIGYFGNCIIVLDGDVSDKDLEAIPDTTRKKMNNIVRLPGKTTPEKVIYNYIMNLPEEHGLWERLEQSRMNWTYFKANDVNSEHYSKLEKERERYKKWFVLHVEYFDRANLFDFWKEDNNKLANDFKQEFKTKYNCLAKRTSNLKIP